MAYKGTTPEEDELQETMEPEEIGEPDGDEDTPHIEWAGYI